MTNTFVIMESWSKNRWERRRGAPSHPVTPNPTTGHLLGRIPYRILEFTHDWNWQQGCLSGME
ncbi:MAG TPA: hypothetical protein VIY49_03800 [Bryobacteraceae bacterium]